MCKATSAESNETDAKCCFSNLFVFMYCMCFPVGIREGAGDDATRRETVYKVCVRVCACVE